VPAVAFLLLEGGGSRLLFVGGILNYERQAPLARLLHTRVFRSRCRPASLATQPAIEARLQALGGSREGSRSEASPRAEQQRPDVP